MFVCVSLSINVGRQHVCMFVCVSALLVSNATAMVRVSGMGWLTPVATVLLMLCSAGFVECLVLNLCCDVWYFLCYVRKNHLLECFYDYR